MSNVQSVLEDQLWLWLKDCETRKPEFRFVKDSEEPDQVVRVLQYGVREGREASEA